MFEEVILEGRIMGYALKRKQRFFFFGTGNTRREDLSLLYPNFEFCFLKQVHGREVVPAQNRSTLEADAHFTETPGLALVSQSADCLPILISSPSRVCAIHAGWKGMALNIIGAAKACMPGLDFAAIGPHILRDSFEVGRDVASQLIRAAPRPDSSLTVDATDPAKQYFDLKKLARNQLAVPDLAVEECCFDTKTNTLFHSYRRGRQTPERQYSFVVIAPELS